MYPLAGCPKSFHGGKDVVFPATISGSNKVWKISKALRMTLHINNGVLLCRCIFWQFSQVYVKGYLDDDENDKVPLTNSEHLDITTFTQMINDYIKDNVGIFSNDNTAKNGTNIIEKLFPGMILDQKGKFYFQTLILLHSNLLIFSIPKNHA